MNSFEIQGMDRWLKLLFPLEPIQFLCRKNHEIKVHVMRNIYYVPHPANL